MWTSVCTLAQSEKYSVLCLEAMALIFALKELNDVYDIDCVKIANWIEDRTHTQIMYIFFV